MSSDTIAKRYAKGLIKTVANEAEFDKVKSELSGLIELFNADPQFSAGMMTPLFSREQKDQLIESLLAAGFSNQTCSFTRVLVGANRLSSLQAIFEVMDEIWQEMHQIEKYTVYSVKPLSLQQCERLKVKLHTLLKKQISLENRLDPSLIAGIKLSRGSVTYDFSIAGNLTKLRNKMVEEN